MGTIILKKNNNFQANCGIYFQEKDIFKKIIGIIFKEIEKLFLSKSTNIFVKVTVWVLLSRKK